MALPDVTRGQLMEALQRFDTEQRTTNAWMDWERSSNQDYALVHEGRRYPPKQIISIATGEPSSSFSGGAKHANAYLHERGFVVERLRQEPTDNTRFSYLLAILESVATERPIDLDAVRRCVADALARLVSKLGDTTENYRESFNRRTIGVSADEFYALITKAVQGDADPLERQIRNADTYAAYLRKEGRAEERLKRIMALLATSPMHSRKTMATDLRDVFRDFNAAIDATGLRLNDGFANAFLASVLAKPFVVLTGLSGSGKTQLGKKFGQWLGSSRLMIIPVRPDWTGPEQLLGYEDALREAAADGRRAWFVPDVLAFLLEASASLNSDDPKPFVLILDEMNLAHVERYFADVLSGMESREGVLPDLERGTDGLWRPRSSVKLQWPNNVVLIGTVNVDETTYMFSPKVLDRAFTLEFRVTSGMLPSTFGAEAPSDALEGPEAVVSAFTAHLLRRRKVAIPAESDLITKEITMLHERLAVHGAEFGFRTVHDASRLASIAAEAEGLDAAKIIDLIVLQKVLPRLHGARKKLEPVLLALGGFCANPRTESADPTSLTAPRLPKSAEKLARMIKALRTNQFTSFAEA